MQTCTGIALGIFPIPFFLSESSQMIIKHSWINIKHGAGNVVAGVIEGIPVVGLICYAVRVLRSIKESDAHLKIDNPHTRKFLPYEMLAIADLRIDDSLIDDKTLINNAQTYNQLLNTYKNSTPAPNFHQVHAFAKQLLIRINKDSNTIDTAELSKRDPNEL